MDDDEMNDSKKISHISALITHSSLKLEWTVDLVHKLVMLNKLISTSFLVSVQTSITSSMHVRKQ
jgi:hypothetical protein